MTSVEIAVILKMRCADTTDLTINNTRHCQRECWSAAMPTSTPAASTRLSNTDLVGPSAYSLALRIQRTDHLSS